MVNVYSTVGDFLLFWNSNLTPNVSERTRYERSRHIKGSIIPCIGSVRLCDFDSSHVFCLRDFLRKKFNSSFTVDSYILSFFRQALVYAKDNLFINDSYCDNFNLSFSFNPKIRVYSESEISSIFCALKYNALYNFYRFIFFTGLSSCEARAIRISDIDLENSTLSVSQRIFGRSRSSFSLVDLSDNRKRSVYLSNEAKLCISNQLEKRVSYNENDFLFAMKDNSAIVDTHFAQARNIVFFITGISDFCTSSLRYSAIRLILDYGLSEKVVQDFMGFSSLRYAYVLSSKCKEF